MSWKFRYPLPILISLFVCATVPLDALSDSATARAIVSITKLPALQLGYVSSDDLYPDLQANQAQTRICLETAGQVLPFRLTAALQTTLSENPAVKAMVSSESSYQLYWSDNGHDHRLSPNLSIKSAMFHAESDRTCDLKTLSIKRKKSRKDSTSIQESETLILTFVVE